MSEHDDGRGDGHEPKLTCREISEFLMTYLDGELEAQAGHEFSRHLGRCPPCGHYLESYRQTVELVRRCGRSELDPEEKKKHGPPPEGLIQAILSASEVLRGGAKLGACAKTAGDQGESAERAPAERAAAVVAAALPGIEINFEGVGCSKRPGGGKAQAKAELAHGGSRCSDRKEQLARVHASCSDASTRAKGLLPELELGEGGGSCSKRPGSRRDDEG
ncbi:zf-HC2 domain-containing protein [Pseudenhygromyxa sp. WMMC2535]|uniref:anti-sigma factor family protein n=1 Tax=Pseudenhygromyxa sp. WMMC2535 TaxID=2712867 RepID=UPI001555749C|nr:zf-HC2 domain-containing protein [Pseudenhygromyxa sp. WMMC2535]NVB38815.1 zf-HC2 domain-containing protein [Pseudenhygromyxa sp. WMMC2535]